MELFLVPPAGSHSELCDSGVVTLAPPNAPSTVAGSILSKAFDTPTGSAWARGFFSFG